MFGHGSSFHGDEVLAAHAALLSEYERAELRELSHVYWDGHTAAPKPCVPRRPALLLFLRPKPHPSRSPPPGVVEPTTHLQVYAPRDILTARVPRARIACVPRALHSSQARHASPWRVQPHPP